MQSAIEAAEKSMRAGFGGPFGACIVKAGEIIAVAANTVLRDNDPTAHAEINAIRSASRKLQSYWLKGCAIFTTCEPCPMCLGAIYWARIEEVYFGCSHRDAEELGFADQFIYDQLGKAPADRSIVFHTGTAMDRCRKLMQAWKDLPFSTY